MYTGKCSIVIPAHNEEQTIRECCLQLAADDRVSEVIVVANACTDATIAKAREGKATVIETDHKGKGNAIKVGIALAREEVILLFDGDIQNPSNIYTSRLLAGMTSPDICLVKGTFDRSDQPGPVTDILVKPSLRAANHPASRINQPLSGMVAVRRSFALGIDIPDDFGVEIAMLLEAYKTPMRVVEVFLPKIAHSKRPWEHYVAMAHEIAETLKRYGIINPYEES